MPELPSERARYCYELMPRNFGGRRPDGSTPSDAERSPINARFFGQSSFATYALADERSAVKAPADLPLEIMGPLACGVMTGAGAVINSLQVRPGQSIAIFGTGAVGLSAVMAAKIVGATRIFAVDVVPARLALAMELVPRTLLMCLLAAPPRATRRGRSRTGPATVSISLSTPRARRPSSPRLWKAWRRVESPALWGAVAPWTPDMFQILSGGRTLRGIIGGDSSPGSFIPLLIEYYRQGRLPFDRLIRFYPFQEIAQAFADCEHGTTVKAVLRM